MTAYKKIQNRIDSTPELADYADLLQYDWEDFDTTHVDWVASAPVAEIVEWAEQIRDSEKLQTEIEEITDPANW